MIRPEFWSSIKISKISQGARLTFIGIWSFADDFGVILGNVNQIQSSVFPWDDDITREIVASYLRELREGGFLHEINYEGKPYFIVNDWKNQQKVDKPSKRCWIKGGHKEIAEILAKKPIMEDSRNTRETFPTLSKINLDEREQEQEQEEEREEERERVKDQKTNFPVQAFPNEGDSNFFGDFEMFRGWSEMSMRLQNAKFKIQSFWEHWEALEWKDTNQKRISLKQKAMYEFQNFEKTGKSAYFGDGPKQDYQSRLKANREELQRDIENGGPFKDEPTITPHLRIQV
jgi:hypothetical protein